MDDFLSQLTLLLCLLLGNFLFGSLPSAICGAIGYLSDSTDDWTRGTKWASFLLYVGAGIFISDSFLILLPHANKEFANRKNHSHEQVGDSLQKPAGEHTGHHDAFPIPEFVVLCGFFLAYVMQEIVFCILSRLNNAARDATDMRVRFCSCAKRHTECSRTFKDARADQTLFGLENKIMESACVPTSSGVATNVPVNVEATAKSELLRSSILAQVVPNYGTVTNVAEPVVDNPLPVLTPPELLADERRLVLEQHDEANHQNKSLTNSMLIVIALTLQYIFLGIHLGSQTDYSKQWSYLSMVCLQNFILTFSASSYLAANNTELSYIALFVGLLSIVSPVGLVAAMVDRIAVGKIPRLAKGIVSAVACGTLLYTTFYEMLRHKSIGSVVGLTKFIAIITGASIMIILHYASLIL